MKRKNIINRIVMIILSLVLVLPFFADCGFYEASESALYVSAPSDVQMTWSYPENIISEHQYYFMSEWKTGELRLFVSNHPFVVCGIDSSGKLSIGKNNLYDDVYFYSYWSTDNVTWTQGNGSDKGYTSFGFSPVDGEYYRLYDANHDIYSLNGDLAFDFVSTSTPILTESEFFKPNMERFVSHSFNCAYNELDYDRDKYPYYIILNYAPGFTVAKMAYVISTEPFTVSWHVAQTDDDGFMCSYGSSGEVVVYQTDDGLEWYVKPTSTVTCFFTESLDNFNCDTSRFYTDLVFCNHAIYSECGTLLYSVPSYNGYLGYLNNVVQKTLALTDSYGNVDMYSFKKIISFDEKSTTGVILNTGEYKIRVYEQICYYAGHTSKVYDDNFPLIQVGEYDIENLSISYLTQNAFEMTTNNTESRYNAWDIMVNSLVRSDNLYYQIVKYNDDGSCHYGGYVKIAHCGDDTSYVSTYGDDLKEDVENGGYIGDDLESGVGTGTNYGDADIDAEEDLAGNGDGVLDDVTGTKELIASLQGVTDFIGAFPSVIGACLGFLPAWLQGLIYSAIGLGVILFIWKIVT